MSIPAALDCTCWKYALLQAVQYVQGASKAHGVDTCEGEWWRLRRRVRGLDRLRAAFDLDVLDRLGAALDLDGLDTLGATYPPVAFDPEARRHQVRVVVVIELLSLSTLVSSSV